MIGREVRTTDQGDCVGLEACKGYRAGLQVQVTLVLGLDDLMAQMRPRKENKVIIIS